MVGCEQSLSKIKTAKKKENRQGGVEDGWIITVTPIRTSCRPTKRCEVGITACGGIGRKNTIIGTKNSNQKNIMSDIFVQPIVE